MNKERRKAIDSIVERLSDLLVEVEAIRDEEQEYFDNMPESFQSSDRGSTAEEAISSLDEAVDGFQTITEALERAAE